MSAIDETIDELFDEIWLQRRQAEAKRLASVDPLAHYCRFSKAYWRYTEDVLIRYVRSSTDQMRLAQAKVLISDRYLELRAYAPKGHRDKLGDKGHVCLYQVWIAGMHEVMATQLTLDPPKVFKIGTPKTEPTAASSSYAMLPPAVFLGEWNG